MRSNFKQLFTALILAFVVSVTAFAQSRSGDTGAPVKVMTRNLYQGTDLTEAMGARDWPEFLGAVTLTLKNVRATKPGLRMAAIAREIAGQEPDLVGLQEATLWQSGLSPDSLNTEADLLQDLLHELENLGQPYVAVATVPEFEYTVPSSLGLYVHMLSRTAILARAEALEDRMQISNVQAHLFNLNLQFFQPVLGTLAIPRGWASVDVSMKGREFRFVTAHPEAFYPPIEVEQVYELLNGPAATALPVVMAADFNADAANPADPTFAAYQAMLAAGFTDTWTAAEPGQAGSTCCQANNLLNRLSSLNQRLDLVLTRGPFTIRGDKLNGTRTDDRVDGLWPSDHAGLVSNLHLRVE
jgi:endonuclease/exonuclease/phosphatase family metal-dependent hydrolase